ncbi:MAG: adaptor protein MecA [Oscillospiraceae bacterium]|nr:adaptor protein MecA [Oscillospiraceae bacterium]
MTIQPIGPGSIAFYISAADLKTQGIVPQKLTTEKARTFARAALLDAGIPLDGAIEIEAYPEVSGVLIFASVKQQARSWFCFPDFEDLLRAAYAIDTPPQEAALFWFDDAYWLSLPSEFERLTARLSEFGREQTQAPFLESSLAEYGRTVLEENALARLRESFPRESGAETTRQTVDKR